ncbi:MAG TPA: amidohydrolase [Candidatus Limnocylindrales bacterium]|nr:amidohydrolase [Candidatus Limnocylindrales bacterium]
MPLDALVTGRIATLGGESGFGWVEAVGITGGRVAFAGSAVDLETRADPFTRRYELDPDEVAIPGLTDAHLHLAEGGIAREKVDLSQVPTLADALTAVRTGADALPDDAAWLEGHGWDPDRFGRWPTADDLESVVPGRRVAIWAHDHHSLWVSRAALGGAGIDRDSPDPDGGLIRHDDAGDPSGILHESAARLVTRHIPPADAERYERLVADLCADLVALGVVAIHDPGALSLQEGLGAGIGAFRALDERGKLPIRVHACIREEQIGAAARAGLKSGDPLWPGADRARFGWLKLFADGTLASRTAALLEPIEAEAGRPLPEGTERGVFLTPPERLAELAREAHGHRIATIIHAIGDWGVRAALDALEPTAGGSLPLMPRLEHVQLLHPDDRPRFAKSRIAASVQPIHLRADAAAARRLWGDRAESNGYTWRSIADTGAILAFGTDAPVEPIDPWPGLSMAVTRRDPSWGPDAPAFGPNETLTLERALRSACVAPAVTAGERDRGRLVPGQRADLVVLPIEALTEPVLPGGALATARPRLVLIDGAVGYEA